jgi:hypothetical protein
MFGVKDRIPRGPGVMAHIISCVTIFTRPKWRLTRQTIAISVKLQCDNVKLDIVARMVVLVSTHRPPLECP